MGKSEKTIRWVLQKNLTNQEILSEIEEVIIEDKAWYDEIIVIPFSEKVEYKKRDNETIVFYGSTTLMINASKNKELSSGVFYNSDSFQMINYIDKWKEKMLNSDSVILTIKEMSLAYYLDDELLFIRPNEDTKSFSGMVITFSEFKQSVIKVVNQNPYISEDSLILVSKPKKIEKEWRNFIVGGKVVSSSRYCVNGQVDININDVSSDLIRFCEERCLEYMPHDIFVMDIALYNGEYYIIECNCFNGTGFYNHNIRNIVISINNFLRL